MTHLKSNRNRYRCLLCLYFLITEGGLSKDGRFAKVSRFNDDLLEELFSREVFSLLLHKQLITLSLVQKILRFRHTDFHVHSQVIATSKEETERVGKYMIRVLLSLQRLSFDETEGPFLYQTKIIDNLKLSFQAERPPTPQVIQKELLMSVEEWSKYF